MTYQKPRFAERHDTFDLMTDKEFHRAFMRISYYVDFKGAFTPNEIDKRIAREASELRFLGERGYMRKETANRRASNVGKVQGTSFGTRTIATARRHPDGLVNLTLNFGRHRAMDALIERNRRLRRMTRIRR
jgi:hypothetical protein